MSPRPLSLPRLRALPKRNTRLERLRVALPDGARTTVHVATYDRAAYRARVVVFEQPTPLVRWCREEGVRAAVVGGFFLRPAYSPLGEVRVEGAPQAFTPFDTPWAKVRACLQIVGDSIRIARRDQLDCGGGDLLQAGPLLVADGRVLELADQDPEGFSAGAHQFDSDITAGRYPRAALGIDRDRLIAVACDGRTKRDSGLTLAELANVLAGLGVTQALNLDGGGSASLVHQGRLRNRPREEHGVDILGGRPVVTAIAFEPR